MADPVHVNPTDLHLIAHTARMLTVRSARADHPRAGEYTEQLAAYRAVWRTRTPEERAAIAQAAEDVHDLTAETIAAAVTALEG